MAGINIDEPVEIAENIYWIGAVDPETSFHCNPYLMIDGDEAILFDPGSMMHIAAVLKKLFSLVKLEQVKYVVVTHQDPDLCASIPLLEKMGGKFKIVTHAKAAVLIKHYIVNSEFYYVSKSMNERKLTLKSGRVLQFYPAWFCHFPGAFVTYDETSKILFSGDLFGGLSAEWSLFANDSYLGAMSAFHENYIPSNEILNCVLKQFNGLPIDIIAPQHGSIIKDNPKFYMDKLSELQCGMDFILCPTPEGIEAPVTEEADYSGIIQAIIKRESDVLGKEKVVSVLKKAGTLTDLKGNLEAREYTIIDLERMMQTFVDEYGPITLMYCRMRAQKLAQEANLALPEILR